jgi:hypothetical protein
MDADEHFGNIQLFRNAMIRQRGERLIRRRQALARQEVKCQRLN